MILRGVTFDFARYMNRNLAKALSWVVFALMLTLSGLVFSTSKLKRRIGAIGFLALLVGQPLTLFLIDKPFDTAGRAQKCYIITRDAIRYGEQPGRDPTTGLECKPLTPEIAERFEEYRSGKRPQRIGSDSSPTFFSERTGNPVVWYSIDKNGLVQAFDLMGFNPDTGEELLAVTKDIVARWQEQSKAPQLIHPGADYAFFDMTSGKSRVWYLKIGAEYEFYDRPGFNPKTGKKMEEVTETIISEWKATQVKRCYILTAKSVKYRTELGIDPETGKECRPFTPDMLVRLREYERGQRPERIRDANPTFFDARSGEPIIWYAESQDKIELFSLMGFHPDTGAELLPVTNAIVARWKDQQKLAITRAPVRIADIRSHTFFDEKTGNPRTWFWKNSDGEYEFYDAPGFHPRSGDQLTVLSKDLVIKIERQAREQLEQEKRRDEARKADEVRRQDEMAKASQAGRACDELAGNPNDGNRLAEGVPYDALKLRAADALSACELAVRQSPTEKRYQYQLARVLQLSDRKRSATILASLVAARYPAAFDNYGWMAYTDRKNPSEATELFRRGVQLNDADSMVSLAEMIDRGFAQSLNPSEHKIALYQRAADLGHKAAERAVQVELGKQNSMQIETAQRLQQQQMMVQMFGTIIQGMARR